MNKDVMVAVKGMQFDLNNEGDDIEVLTPGQYYSRGGMHYITYDEPVPDSKDIIKTRIKFNGEIVTVTRTGSLASNLVFDTAKKNITSYRTPFGNLAIGIETHNILIKETESRLEVRLNYSMDINYEYVSDFNVSITVTSASDTDL